MDQSEQAVVAVRPKAAVRKCLFSADSVEKVGHGCHGRKVSA
ncbi:hypothetical protein [Pseudomonas atacamensis]